MHLCAGSGFKVFHRMNSIDCTLELKSYRRAILIDLLLTTIAGGVEERGDRSRGACHPAPAAAGAGEGAQPEGGRQGALKAGYLVL